MRRTTLGIFTAFCLLSSSVHAEDKDVLGVRRSLMDEVYVVETDEASSADALDRISGDIDLGFSLPEQSYESEGHSKASPFARQTTFDNSETHGY
jgi:hypothetical protein